MGAGYGAVPQNQFATETIDGEKFLVVKINIGEDGKTANISIDDPLPVRGHFAKCVVDLLGQLLEEQRITNFQLTLLTDVDLSSLRGRI